MSLHRILSTSAPRATMLVRFAVGTIFVSEGVQKFHFPAALGIGRFTKIRIPRPEILAPLVGAIEIGCGVLLLIGLATRLAALPLIGVMIVAICTTKVPMLAAQGFWAMAHEARTDWSMLLGLVFLAIVGGGRWSVDAKIHHSPSTG